MQPHSKFCRSFSKFDPLAFHYLPSQIHRSCIVCAAERGICSHMGQNPNANIFHGKFHSLYGVFLLLCQISAADSIPTAEGRRPPPDLLCVSYNFCGIRQPPSWASYRSCGQGLPFLLTCIFRCATLQPIKGRSARRKDGESDDA